MFRIAGLIGFTSLRKSLKTFLLLLGMFVATTNCAFPSVEVDVDEIISTWSKSAVKQKNMDVKITRVVENHLQRTCAIQDAEFHYFANEWNELRIQQSQQRVVPQKVRIEREGNSQLYQVEAIQAEHWIRNLSNLRMINHLEKQVLVLDLNENSQPFEAELLKTITQIFLLLRGPHDKSEILSNWDVELLSHSNSQSKLRLTSRQMQRASGRDVPNRKIDIFLRSINGEVLLTGFNYEAGGSTYRWKIISREIPALDLASKVETTNSAIDGYRSIQKERAHGNR